MDAVIRNITVIGETASHVPPEISDRHPQVPWKEMRDIRNIVIHEYFGVGLNILWETVRNDLPLLVPLLKEVLA